MRRLRTPLLIPTLALNALVLSACVGLIPSVIDVGSVTLTPGSSGQFTIEARSIPRGLQGLEVSSAAGHHLSYDASVIEVTNVEAIPPFQLDAFNVDNNAGRISFVARAPVDGPFPVSTGVIKVSFDHIGGEETSLDLEITNLANGDGEPVRGTTNILSGKVTVK